MNINYSSSSKYAHIKKLVLNKLDLFISLLLQIRILLQNYQFISCILNFIAPEYLLYYIVGSMSRQRFQFLC